MKTLVKSCFITIAVVLLLAIVLAAYAFLYVPKAEKLAQKLDKNEGVTATYYESVDVASASAKLMLLQVLSISGFDPDGVSMVEFSQEGEDGYYGLVIYTDKIKTAFTAMIDYIKYVMDESNTLDYHISCRGRAIFVGDANAEIAFRKILI